MADPGNDHRGDESPRALLEAAVAVFSAKGVSAASVDDIVRAAGVAKGTFYLYFATKDDAVERRRRVDGRGRGGSGRGHRERIRTGPPSSDCSPSASRWARSAASPTSAT